MMETYAYMKFVVYHTLFPDFLNDGLGIRQYVLYMNLIFNVI